MTLRYFAAFQVLIEHSMGWLKLPGSELAWQILGPFGGVPIFFTISGFLITKSFLGSGSSLEYFKRRALRIYPALALSILFVDAAYIFNCTGSVINVHSGIEFYLIYIATASQQLAAIQSGFVYGIPHFYHDYPSGVLWTLIAELSFYAVLPAIFLYADKRRVAVSLLVGITAVSSAYLDYIKYFSGYDERAFSVVVMFWPFAPGVLAALWWDRIAGLFRGKLWFWLPLFLAWVIFEQTVLHRDTGIDLQGPRLLTFINMVLVAATTLAFAFSTPLLNRFGQKIDLTYGIYLYHMLVVQTLVSLGMAGHLWTLPVVMVGAVSLAFISWTLVEKPALALKNFRLPSRRTAIKPQLSD